MKFLFIWQGSGVLGGVETLIARMSHWLVGNGHQVTLLIERGDNWIETLPREVQCIVLKEKFRHLYFYLHTKRLWDAWKLPTPDVIKSFDLGSSWIACQLASVVDIRCKVLAGVYSPLPFSWYDSKRNRPPWHASRFYLRNYLNRVPVNARIFCGIDQLEELDAEHGQTGLLLPLPIDTSQFEPVERKKKWGKLVSVGRLSAMKEYNLYMIDVVKELRGRGHDVTWSVYGTGEYEPEMRKLIEQNKVKDFVSIEGTVPYSRFWKVLADAHVFIGMGTALLEASLFKVPNVEAQAYDRKGMTSGPVYCHPKGSIGPSFSTPVNRKVADEIERILKMSDTEYAIEGDRVYDHASVHQMDAAMQSFLEITRNADPFVSRKSVYLANYPLWFVRRLMRAIVGDRGVVHPPSPITLNTKQPVNG